MTGFNTKLLHGRKTVFKEREILPPISQVTAFRYESMEELEKVFSHKAAGFAYTRIGNPTLTAFENRMAYLCGGQSAISCSSGMSAISSALLCLCEAGDEIIASTGLYGGTIDLFHDLKKLGIKTNFVEELNEENIKPLINERTRVIVGELIGNPSLKVMDVPLVSRIAHENSILLMVDSTSATPYICRPIELGADIDIHSTSKYINGGGNSIGGVIIDAGRFDYDFSKYTSLSEFKAYKKMAFSVRLRTDIWENLGGCMAPQNAFLSYIGADTLGLRMEKICNNAKKLADALYEQDKVKVNYLTLKDHPYHSFLESELNGLGGGILTFRAGSKEKAFKIINSLKYAVIASNIGDLRTLVIHPSSTLYIRVKKEEQEAAGVFFDTVRVSVGIEDPDDLINDFLNAIEIAEGGE